MNKIFWIITAMVGNTVAAATILSQQSSIGGDWSGSISVAGQAIPMSVHFTAAEDGLSAAIDIQGATGLPLQSVSYQPPKVHFELPAGGPLQIRLTALRGYQLRLNGNLIGERDAREGNWKRQQELTISEGLQATNSLAVEVRNSTGPALLRLSADAPRFQLETDSSWNAVDSMGNVLPAAVHPVPSSVPHGRPGNSL